MFGQIKITDRAKYREYAASFLKVLQMYQGELLCLAETFELLEGQWPHPRTVVVKFADKEAALKWYHSKEYQALVEIRKDAAQANIVLVENTIG